LGPSRFRFPCWTLFRDAAQCCFGGLLVLLLRRRLPCFPFFFFLVVVSSRYSTGCIFFLSNAQLRHSSYEEWSPLMSRSLPGLFKAFLYASPEAGLFRTLAAHFFVWCAFVDYSIGVVRLWVVSDFRRDFFFCISFSGHASANYGISSLNCCGALGWRCASACSRIFFPNLFFFQGA